MYKYQHIGLYSARHVTVHLKVKSYFLVALLFLKIFKYWFDIIIFITHNCENISPRTNSSYKLPWLVIYSSFMIGCYLCLLQLEVLEAAQIQCLSQRATTTQQAWRRHLGRAGEPETATSGRVCPERYISFPIMSIDYWRIWLPLQSPILKNKGYKFYQKIKLLYVDNT